MNNSDFIKRIFTLLFFSFIMNQISATYGLEYDNRSMSDNHLSRTNQFYDDDSDAGYDTSMNGYHSNSIDYYYNYSNSRYNDSRGFNSSIGFGRSFDNSNHFNSGVSSYQGTSTGPGPNGGYPGTPHGTYQTHYFDNSIYPNTYLHTR